MTDNLTKYFLGCRCSDQCADGTIGTSIQNTDGDFSCVCEPAPPVPAPPVPAPPPTPAPAPTGSLLNTAIVAGGIAVFGTACAVLNARSPNIQNDPIDSSSSSDDEESLMDASISSDDSTSSGDSTSSDDYTPVPSTVPSAPQMIGGYGSSSWFRKHPRPVCPGSPDCP
jgi:hypothetical protein